MAFGKSATEIYIQRLLDRVYVLEKLLVDKGVIKEEEYAAEMEQLKKGGEKHKGCET